MSRKKCTVVKTLLSSCTKILNKYCLLCKHCLIIYVINPLKLWIFLYLKTAPISSSPLEVYTRVIKRE